MQTIKKSLFLSLAIAVNVSLLSACSSMGGLTKFSHSAKTGDKTAEAVRASLPKTESALVNATYPALPPSQGMVRLVEGQSVFLKDKDLNIKFVRVLDDSRCPQHSQCIWAGSATVELEVMKTSSRPQTIQLTNGALKGDQQLNANILSYNVSLETVYPTPATDLDKSKMVGKYVIDVKVGAEKPIVTAKP